MAKQFKYDVAKQGPLSWRDLQEANNERFNGDEESQWIINKYRPMSPVQVNRDELLYEGPVQSPILRNSNGKDYWGKSMWDTPNATAEDFYNNLSDLRGQNQPWYAQLGAGLLKGVTTFATTWLDGIVGLLYGAYKAGLSPDDKTGWDRAALLFHNSVSDSLQDFNEFMEEFAPNYKSRDEENNKWYQNMGTMNFWADGLIKNLGFTVGAFYSGSIFTKALKGIGGLIAAGKAGKAAKAYKAAKVKELVDAGMSAEEAAKAVNPMATATRYTNTLKAIEGARSGTGIAVAGSLFSAVNEGRIEANQVYRDAFTLGNTPEESKGAAAEILAARNRKMQEIEDDQTLLPSEKQALQAQVQANSQKLLAEAEQNAAKAGMLTLGLNIPILTIDNFKMYGRLYSRGFKQSVKQVSNNVTTQELKAAQDAVKNATTKQEKEAAKRALKEAERKAKAAHNARNNARIDDVAENVTEKEGRLAWNEITKGQAAWRGIKSGLIEGNEEMMQAWASGTAGNMTMPEDPDAYYKALTDPNATVKTNDFLTSVTKGFLDSYGNMDRWEEGAIGFLTGILGMPTFGARANSDSNTYLGRGKMIGLSGGFFGEFSNANYLNRLGAESVKNINAFRDKYRQHAQFLAQSQAFTDAMDGYLQDKDEFAYNNARDNDDFAMIQALAVTGRIDEVKAMLNFKKEDLTDDILDSIANDFTENSNLVDSDGNPKTVDDNGKPLQGAWRDKAGNPMSRTGEGKAEMKAKLLEKQKRLNEEIDDYVASLDSVRAQVNNSLDESQVRELAWLDWKNKQWSRRFQDIQGTQEKAFDRLLEATEEALNAKTDEGGQYYTNEADSPIKREKLENLRDLLKEMKKAKSPREILSLLIKNTDTINSLFRKPEASEKEATLYDVISGWINDPVALADLAESLYDIRLMAIAQKQFSDKLDEYTSNPSKLAENRQRIEEERQETQSITDDINTVERVKNMSVSDMSKLSNDELGKLAQSTSLDDESKKKIEERQKIDALNKNIVDNINNDSSLNADEKKEMLDLIDKQRTSVDSAADFLSPDTELMLSAANNAASLDKGQDNAVNKLRDKLDSMTIENNQAKPIENTAPTMPVIEGKGETGHDPTSTVNTAQEARQEKEDKQKKEEEEKKSTEETNKIWDELIALAAEGKEAEMANKAHSIRSIIRKKIGEAVDKGDTPITEAQTGNYIVAAMRSQPYKDMEQLVSEENKSALLPTLRDVIAKYVQYYNSLLAERNATSTTNTASVIEEDPRTPDVTEDDLINYAESVKNNNNQREKRAEERDTWHPNTSHYGFGVSEFGTPKYDDETGLELKFYERVTGEKPEGHYSAKVRAKIETIAKWFEKKGVYDNIDTALGGRVKAGHKVVFTTSDELNKEVKEAVKKATGENIEPVIILMAVEIDGALHIMGDLKSVIGIEDSGIIDTPLNNFSVAFNSAYGKWKAENKQGAFTFGETVIKQGMVGRMIFNNKTEFNTLNSVFGDKLHLGIALKDDKTEALDVITTPGKSKKNEKSAEEKSIRRPNSIKAGQPFVVIPSMISGASIAVPFVTPSLDEVMSRQDANELLIVQNIKGVLSRLALTDFDSMPEEELKNELLNIKDEIKSYINVDFFLSYDKKTHQIKFNGTKDDKRIGNFVININVENEDTTERERRVINGILADFRKKGVGFQIDRNQINTGNYNKMIGEIAKINLPKNTPYHTSNDWFTVNKVTSTGKTVRGASVIPSLGSNPHAATSEVVVSTKQGQARVDINKKTVTLEDGTVITNLDTNERAKKIWAYGFGQGRKYFENKPTNKTAPYKTPVGWFDPVKTEFINEREAEKRTKNRSNTDNAVNTLIKSITDKYKGDLTFDVSERSDGYPVVKITSNNEGDLYTYIFRVKDGNIESAAGWTSDNPANWEVDNSVTNRGGDTISFTPVLDFYKTLGFTPKPAHTTTTQTTTEQQATNGGKSFAEKAGFVFEPVKDYKQKHGIINVYPKGKTNGSIQYEGEVEAKKVALAMLQIFKEAKDYQDLHDRIRSRWGMPITELTSTNGYWEAFKDGRISEQDVLDLFTPNSYGKASVPASQTTTEQQSNTDLANMSQNEYAEWLKVNGKPNGAESATFYDLLTARSRYRGENFNDRMKYYQDNIEALKALTAFLQEICSKFLNGTISVDGVKASSKGTGWNHFIINNDTKHSTETNKGYITLTQDSVLSLTENDIVDFLKAVQESGFNGQVKFPEIGSRMILAFDNFVIHGQTKEDVDKAMAVAEKFWGSKIEATQRGVDKNGTSHTDVLAKEVEEAIKNGKQPTTPQVSEQAPSTEITKEEREKIIKDNQVELPKSKYPSNGKNIGGYLAQISSNDGGSWGRVADTDDGSSSYYRMFDVNGDTAKFEFYAPGREQRGISKWSSILDSVADYDGNRKTADTIFTVEAGEVKRNSNGRWVVTKRIQLQLVKKEDITDNVYTDTEAVKRDIDILQRDKNRKRQAWENQKREQEQKEEKQKVEEKQEAEQKPVENPEQLEKEAQDKLIEEAKAEQQKTPTDYVNGWIEELRNEGNSSAQLYADMWEALGKRGWQEDAFEKTKKKGVPNKDKFIKMMNTIKANYDSTNKKDFTQKIDFKKARYRKTEDNDTKWNREQEMAWLKKALPQLSNEQRVQIVDGLIKVADSDNPGYAWGQFCRGLITISSEAASGTLYHEAFHAVVDLLMTEDEYNKLFDAAYQVWGNLGMLGLEEKLAEEFRKFVQYGDNAAFVDYDAEDIKTPIIRGIVRLFRRLKALIQGLSNKQIYLNKLFYDINKGKFADRKVQEGRNLQPKFDINERELEDIKKKAIADGTFMKAPNGKPTNLNERQWLQVRTKAFKEWFGDWEHNARLTSIIESNDFEFIFEDIPNAKLKIGSIVNAENSLNNLCLYTRAKAIAHLNKLGFKYVSAIGGLRAKSPVMDKTIVHHAAILNIGGKLYLYDMPQTEFITPTDKTFGDKNQYKEAIVTSNFKPRFIELTVDNLVNIYGDTEDHAKWLVEDQYENNYKDNLINASKVVDENGEPLVVYHSNTLDKNYKTVSQIVPNFDLDSKPGRYQVGVSYADFNKLSDKDVATLLSYNYVEFYRDYLIVTEAHFGTTEDRLNAFEVDKRSLKRLRKFHPEIVVRDIENISIPDMVNPFIDNIVTTDVVSDDEELWQQALNNPKYEGRAKTYFTDKKNLKYSNNFGRATAAVFLNIKHPFDYDNATKQEKENYFRNDFGSNNIKGIKLLRDGYDGATAYLTTRPEYVPFTPNQIKSATDNVGTFSRENNDIRYMMVGEKAALQSLQFSDEQEANERIQNLEVAKQMEQSGKDALTIKQATGWEKGVDGKWRYEVEDLKFDVDRISDAINSGDPISLLTIATGTSYNLIKDYANAYKWIKDTEVDFLNSREMGELYGNSYYSVNGFVNKGSNKIYINLDKLARFNRKTGKYEFLSDTKLYKTLLHELQHLIQFDEGFSVGHDWDSSYKLFTKKRDEARKRVLAKIKSDEYYLKKWNELVHLVEKNGFRTYNTFPIADEYISDLVNIQLDNIEKRLKARFAKAKESKDNITLERLRKEGDDLLKVRKLAGYFTELLANELGTNEVMTFGYWHDAGEVEARTTEKRSNLSLEERRNSLFTDDMFKDVAREDIIIMSDMMTSGIQASISRAKTDDMSVKQYHFQKLMYVNLSEEDKEYIKERGMSVRDYSSMSQAEKELFWKCR